MYPCSGPLMCYPHRVTEMFEQEPGLFKLVLDTLVVCSPVGLYTSPHITLIVASPSYRSFGLVVGGLQLHLQRRSTSGGCSTTTWLFLTSAFSIYIQSTSRHRHTHSQCEQSATASRPSPTQSRCLHLQPPPDCSSFHM